ncbi:hypothetical protein CTAYLR_001865 [Chrysophaeum taylorii]|uniref:DNA polymerase epsilon catalytic subunit n=1 Tax=Chrysophaeum taylorii TaxID=2483200 RepID=A0AAD7UAC5_9STRA|nr:hypothetical protein CTAYLR_001865 [Chrysophaeum taylorii]
MSTASSIKNDFEEYQGPEARVGWVLNMLPATSVREGVETQALELFLISRDGRQFRTLIPYEPYFYVRGEAHELSRYRGEAVDLVDLEAPDHVAGATRRYVKVKFRTVQELVSARKELEVSGFEMREFDIPYAMRAAIDLDLRVGAWYEITKEGAEAQNIIEKPAVRVLAFDIECTKSALKFPNPEHDEVFMISYMVDGQGYLIISRAVVSEDIENFEYSPNQFRGPFEVFNEVDEASLLERFIRHCRDIKPHVYVTYNGDYFDWPFLKRRCQEHGMDLGGALGVDGEDEFRGTRGPVHLDAFYWVKRDSYLPQGSQGLKAVTKCKLGYDPVEVDPEDMVRFAAERPREMAAYSVSDAVATYYLYIVYVNLFIFSLCTVIPNGAEDVLRKGSGTLCESLLLVEARKARVVAPNKRAEATRHQGRLIESETYVGGHVECLETGVFRSDLEYDFSIDEAAVRTLIDNVERDVKFAIRVEGARAEDCANLDAVVDEIRTRLATMLDDKSSSSSSSSSRQRPSIYHLDVGAMYPNIILTNRLQPTAIASRETCANCSYNGTDGDKCKRPMDWIWRGELNPASAAEVNQLRRQLAYEGGGARRRPQEEEGARERNDEEELRKRARDYAQKVYKKTKVVKEENRTDVVCMRENSFYVDTVRAFRDRRYEYKALVKKWRKKKHQDPTARDKELLFESLQLAHKCILNSFYGYVMRKGARWRSMPMAGIVTLTGANLITQARELVERVGRPLELDTDGIWCMLPSTFPENFDLEFPLLLEGGKKKTIQLSYPCAMLNADVHANFSNHQYQTLDAEKNEWTTSSECSIFFEVDGPYRCMVLPASTEEGKLLKKRYAVFNHDGSLAELKGFELKRRGELELVKTFQSEVFGHFLKGDTLSGCYAAVADVANQYLDVLDARGAGIDDDELLDLISENRAMSKDVSEYEGRKMTSLTTARRLADFLGDDMLVDSKGIQCKLIIASKPAGAPITDRAVPTAIFSTEPAVRRHFLRKWLKDSSIEGDVREVLDWDYYRDRLEGVIRKIITIPAELQKIENPVPRVAHPDWLKRLVAGRDDARKQTKIDTHFVLLPKKSDDDKKRLRTLDDDIEDCSWLAQKERLSPPRIGISTRKNKMNEEPSAADQKRVKAGPPPQVGEGFAEWLADRKARWRARTSSSAAERRSTPSFSGRTSSRHNTAAETGAAAAKGLNNPRKRAGVVDLVRRTNASLTRGAWSVLEVRETDVPGEFEAFVLTDAGLHRVAVSVARLVYVQVREEAAGLVAANGGRKASHWRALGESAAGDLYELKLPERRVATKDKALATFLAHPGVEAAYELSTPPWFRALLTIGAGARVLAKDARKSRFDLDDLEPAAPPASFGPDACRVAFLYVSQCARTGRGVVALFFLSSPAQNKDERAATATFVVVDPFAPRGDKPPALRRIYESARSEDARGWANSLEISKAEVARERSTALAAVAAALTERKRRGATLVVVESAVPAALLRRSVPALGDFPNLELRGGSTKEEAFPSLGWRNAAARRAIDRLLECPTIIEERFATARFANLPVANLGDDPLIRVADVAFARLLRRNRHLLWASEAPKPDLGAGDDDDRATSSSSSRWSFGLGDDDDDESISSSGDDKPGAYRRACVELDVFGSAVNAVMVADQLDDDDDDVEGGATTTEAIAGTAGDAFRLARALVVDWIDDVSARKSPHADALLVGLYRWLCARASLLHFPALRRVVLDLMRRVNKNLVAQLEKLGVRVVHASFHKLVLATPKHTVREAERHLDFVAKTLADVPAFRFLALAPKTFYSSLLFLDRRNFAGIVDDERLASTWALAAPLPELARDYFAILVGAFLHNKPENHDDHDAAAAANKKFFDGYLAEKALAVVAEMQRSSPTAAAAAAPLDFVTLLCHVLALDKTVETHVIKFRRLLLATLGVRDFSPQAHLRPKAIPVILPDVICASCNLCSDLDLSDTAANRRADDDRNLLCENCQHPYDTLDLELQLLERLDDLSLAVILQDLRCIKCSRVATASLATLCPCSGKYALLDAPPAKHRAYLGACRVVADNLNMPILAEYCQHQLGPS